MIDLRVALGIPNSQGASKYGVVSIPKEEGSTLQASLRVTIHQANVNTYIDHNANYEYNLSIVIRRKQRKTTFITLVRDKDYPLALTLQYSGKGL